MKHNVEPSLQVADRLVSIAKNVIPSYQSWIDEITESHNKFLELRSITENSFMNKSFEELSGFRESQVFDLIKILWSGKAFGSLGRGGVREEAVEENFEVFYYATRDLLDTQRRDAPPSEVLKAIKLQVDGRGELRAIKLRALSIVSDLRIPSLFSRRLFLKVAKFLNISLDFPDDLENLGYILNPYLLNHQQDKYTKYVFPWIVYEWYNEYYESLDLIMKVPELKKGSKGASVKAAQKMLNMMGSKLSVDGLFGMDTENEVLIFQKDYKLKPNGLLNQETLKILVDLVTDQGEDLLEIVKMSGLEEELGTESDEKKSPEGEKITLPSGLATIQSEGDHSHDDQLEFKNDYTALANLVAYKEVNPPLAIGLFGHWGSGKSFFMEKMYDTIKDLSKRNNKVYCENIVQVKFNSWHYSDANLWASLVTEIFETINEYFEGTDQIFEQLASSREQLKQAGNEKKNLNTKNEKLTDRLESIQKKKQDQETDLDSIKRKDIIEWVKSDPWISRKRKEIEGNLKKDQEIDLNKIQTQIQELNGFWKKLKRSFELLKKYKTGNWVYLIIIAIIIFIVINYAFPNWLTDLGVFKEFLKGIVSLVTIGLPTILNVFRKVEKGLDRLIEVDAGWEEVQEKARKRKTSEEITLQKELDKANAQEDILTQRQSEIQEKINLLDSELSDIRSGKNLSKFIREKSQDQRYKSELGIISWIRKDFEELNNLLIKQKVAIKRKDSNIKKKEEENKSIDRIVLYIDDLDRCGESRVVEVLQAVHLLLAFPLFAVVVGVDPRWVSRALLKEYPELLENRNNKSSHSKDKLSEKEENEEDDSLFNEGGSATAFDYLEKIFQIPFSLKIVQEKTAKDLIRSLAKPGKSIHGKDIVIVVDEQVGVTESVGVSKSTKKTDKSKETSETQSKTTSTPPEVKEPDPKALEISKEEGDFMNEIASNIGYTPRTINRYINIYKIIRSHGGVIHSENQLEDYKAIMIMLSIVTGMNFEPDKLFDEMKKSNAKTIETFLKASKILFPKKNLLLKNIPAEDLKIALEKFKSNIDLVSRFSYRL